MTEYTPPVPQVPPALPECHLGQLVRTERVVDLREEEPPGPDLSVEPPEFPVLPENRDRGPRLVGPFVTVR